jgi:hypothetical protein
MDRFDSSGALDEPFTRFADDPELRALGAALLERARRGNTITLRTRSVGTEHQAAYEITFAPAPGGEVELRSRSIDADPGEPLSAYVDGSMLLLCAWCYRAERNGWRNIEEVLTAERLLERPHAPLITHGICDACMAEQSAELDGPSPL